MRYFRGVWTGRCEVPEGPNPKGYTYYAYWPDTTVTDRGTFVNAEQFDMLIREGLWVEIDPDLDLDVGL